MVLKSRLKILFSFIFLVSVIETHCQEILVEKKWSSSMEGVEIAENERVNNISISSHLLDSIFVKKEFKFENFERGSIEISGQINLEKKYKVPDVEMITIAYKEKNVISYLSERLFTTNLNFFKYYVPFESEVDSLVVFISVRGGRNLDLDNIRFKFTEGEFSESWDEHFAKIAKNIEKINQLELIGKVWGFLKYFSPTISENKLDWDQVLRDELYTFFYSNNPAAYQDIVDNLFLRAGFVYPTEESKDGVFLEGINVDYSWIDNSSLLTSKHRSLLYQIIDNFRPFKNQYITTADLDGSLLTKIKENTYHKNNNVNLYDRILNLFRYWNIINYYYPYKVVLKDEWPDLMSKWIPDFILANNSLKYANKLLQLNAELKDGHSSIPIYSPYEFMIYVHQQPLAIIPAQISIIENQVKITEIDSLFSHSTGIRVGDRVISIENIDINEIIKNLKPYIGSYRDNIKEHLINKNNFLSYVSRRGDSVSIEIYRDGNDEVFKFKSLPSYYSFLQQLAKPQNVLNTGVKIQEGILQLNDKTLYMDVGEMNLYLDDDSTIFNGIENVILDLRKYPKTFQDFPVFTKPESVFSYIQSSIYFPGHLRTIEMLTPKTRYSFPGKVIALISEETISNGEFLSLMLKTRENKVEFIGRTTAGANGNVLNIPLIGFQQIFMNMSSIRVLDRDKKETMGIGIDPDRYIGYEKEYMNDGTDKFIELALEIVK